jgi:ribonuclease HI
MVVRIYTDGACLGNPGPGGYGVVLLGDGSPTELSRGFRATTNNRMEVMAALAGLAWLEAGAEAEVVSDSEYLVTTVNAGRLAKWQANQWRRADGSKVLNRDLWERLVVVLKLHPTTFRWIRAHSGDHWNERCDRMAVEAARGLDLDVDDGYEEAHA